MLSKNAKAMWGMWCASLRDPHRTPQLGIIRCVPNDVILRRCNAKEIKVIGAGNTGRGLLRVIAIQDPNIIMTQEGVL